MYPVFLNLKGSLCVVLGGGKVAERKVKKLLEEKAEVLIISPKITDRINELCKKNKVKFIKREYEFGDIPENTLLVFECTGDIEVAKKARKECEMKKVLMNSATVPELCDFIVPASFKKGSIHIALSTEGKCSAFAKALREKIEKEIPYELSVKLNTIEKLRKNLKKQKGKKGKEDDKILLEISRLAVENPKLPQESFSKIIEEKIREIKSKETKKEAKNKKRAGER
ncbi:Precorrin-2 dehydrogenase [bacterium HR19]|nr:Precorrin-2 dehydrogenase [bacterium HR19]